MKEITQCNKCIMDMSDPDIKFNSDGICNHCIRYEKEIKKRVQVDDSEFNKLIKKIKKSGRKKRYDCIVGVSGGVDSTYVIYLLVKQNLNPLAVHFDNGWNSELAVSNIEKVIDVLNVDLFTYVMDWEAFREIQKGMLRSLTPDGEIPTDHAINATLLDVASKHGVKYIINGMNFSTEGMAVPAWSYGHSDWCYIKSVLKYNGVKRKALSKYPHFSLTKLFYHIVIKRVKIVSILNYIEYNKENVLAIIKNKLGYRPYPQKHYESVYTRFYQGYYLPEKFNIDKRRGHYSDLIRSEQLDRNKALKMINTDPYEDDVKRKDDISFVLKKLRMKNGDLKKLIDDKNKGFNDYKNSSERIFKLKEFYNSLRLKGIFSK